MSFSLTAKEFLYFINIRLVYIQKAEGLVLTNILFQMDIHLLHLLITINWHVLHNVNTETLTNVFNVLLKPEHHGALELSWIKKSTTLSQVIKHCWKHLCSLHFICIENSTLFWNIRNILTRLIYRIIFSIYISISFWEIWPFC